MECFHAAQVEVQCENDEGEEVEDQGQDLHTLAESDLPDDVLFVHHGQRLRFAKNNNPKQL